MKSSIPSSFCMPLCAVALCLIVLSGCEDMDARMSAQEATRQINDLKSKIDEANKKNEAVEASVKELRNTLQKQLDARIDKIEESVAANQKRVLEQIGLDVKTSRDAAMALADTARQDNDKELKSTKQILAENMQTIRAEMAVEFDKLHKFMDNQLKEVYPYAYQPRRMDPAVPPGEKPADAPKKVEAAPEQK